MTKKGIIQDLKNNPHLLLNYLKEYSSIFPEECENVIFSYIYSDTVLKEYITQKNKLRRNSICPCNQGKKYKKCHLPIIELVLPYFKNSTLF